eukprot:7695009-Alexandrium_andersonii.AAC.1
MSRASARRWAREPSGRWAVPTALLGLQPGSPEADRRPGPARPDDPAKLCRPSGAAMRQLGDPDPPPAHCGALIERQR